MVSKKYLEKRNKYYNILVNGTAHERYDAEREILEDAKKYANRADYMKIIDKIIFDYKHRTLYIGKAKNQALQRELKVKEAEESNKKLYLVQNGKRVEIPHFTQKKIDNWKKFEKFFR